MKKINLNRTVYDICTEYPEVLDILKDIGFSEIVKPGMLNTAGRFMTIPKGSVLRKINMEKIKKAFWDKDFELFE
ncbi:MAG TPA: DUF1858 domain-containing protein [Clostridia bacterium]|nr:MAG: hypothetical protein BWX97_01265 [Firmicutes bacterium ADurb.Bin146]HOD93318.1 DUF1858 domain-containing protein [Clostridia bacterium]HQM39574.1 DUF1858 domain-containing protein [Clostridia bacterium]